MSRSRTIGFGTAPGPSGVVVSPDVLKEQVHPEQASAEYLREIRDRYVLPGGLQPFPFSLAANAATKFDVSQTTYNALCVTVNSGVANIWLGDNTSVGGTTGTVPHFVVSASITPVTQVIPLPPGGYVFTVQADNSGTAAGYLIPMAL